MPDGDKSHVVNAGFFYPTYFLWGQVVWSGGHSGKTLPKAQRMHGIEYLDLFNTAESSGMDLLKLLHWFVRVVIYISRRLPNKTNMKFDLDIDFSCLAQQSLNTRCLGSIVPLAMFISIFYLLQYMICLKSDVTRRQTATTRVTRPLARLSISILTSTWK